MVNIDNIRILVVGDIMLDRYVIGDVVRVSPEAPVPIVNVTKEYYTLGGCGNVVRNIREIGGKVDCLASIGNDYEGQIVLNKLRTIKSKSLIIKGSKRTIVKERIISNQRHVQMLRIDREIINPVSFSLLENVLETINFDEYNVIVISDYAKGMITERLIKYLKTTGQKIIIDPKPSNGRLYDEVYMITPNQKEWEIMSSSSDYNLTNISFILVTKGENGMTLFEPSRNCYWNIKSEPVKIYNVSGAGDTVVAIMAICLSMGWKEYDAISVANKCAAHVVTQPGTSVISKDIFESVLKSKLSENFKNSIKSYNY